jgi:hypothetical protein
MKKKSKKPVKKPVRFEEYTLWEGRIQSYGERERFRIQRCGKRHAMVEIRKNGDWAIPGMDIQIEILIKALLERKDAEENMLLNG